MLTFDLPAQQQGKVTGNSYIMVNVPESVCERFSSPEGAGVCAGRPRRDRLAETAPTCEDQI